MSILTVYLLASHGLKHPLNHLQSIRSEIAFYPLERQAMYADLKHIRLANDPEFLRCRFSQFNPNDKKEFRNINATAIGNLAYVALHCRIIEIKEKCLKFLENYKQHILNSN